MEKIEIPINEYQTAVMLKFNGHTLTGIIDNIDRDKPYCEGCGIASLKLDRHHIIPKNKGGNNDKSNLKHLCPNCHRIAHTTNKTPTPLFPVETKK